jgi:hypothetical protein
MQRLVTAASCAAIACALYSVQVEAREVTVKGLGNKPCSAWTEAHRTKKGDATLQDTWLAGFMTGFNAYGLKDSKDVAAGVDPTAIQATVSSYCQSHPSDTLFKASVALIGDLQKKSSAK